MLQFKSYPSFSFYTQKLYDFGTWKCNILSLDVCDGYYKITLDTSENIINMICGNGGYHWIFFPDLGVGTIFGSYGDYDYNYSKLCDIYDDIDALSIVCCMSNVENFVHKTSKMENMS